MPAIGASLWGATAAFLVSFKHQGQPDADLPGASTTLLNIFLIFVFGYSLVFSFFISGQLNFFLLFPSSSAASLYSFAFYSLIRSGLYESSPLCTYAPLALYT